MIQQRTALVERPVACSGKGNYIASIYYGSKGGRLFHKVLTYSYKDPRYKDEAIVLSDISRMIPSRHRDYIIAISVIKRCLHPKVDTIARKDRVPHYERVFSWVVTHENTVHEPFEEAMHHYSKHAQNGHKVQTITLPYTPAEIQSPIEHIMTTNYWPDVHASVGLRGVERTVSLKEVVY